MVIIAFLVYDWLINLDEEMALIWCHPRRRTLASLVYAAARYIAMIQYVLDGVMIGLVNLSLVSTCIFPVFLY